MKTLLPLMFGPVRMRTCSWAGSRSRSLGVKGRSAAASRTGWRPSRMSRTSPSSTSGRTYPRSWATWASEARASRAATARAVLRRASASAATAARTSWNSSSSRRALRAQDPALVLLELGGDVALRPHQGLPPDIVLRHLGRVRVRDLDAVAEDPVEAHAQRGDLGALALARLQRGDPLPRLLGAALDLLELGRECLPDETALLEAKGRIVLEGLGEERGEGGQAGHLLTERGRDEARQVGELRAELRHGGQAAPEPHEVPRVRLPEGGPTRQALEIADGAETRAQGGPPRRLLDQGGHRRLAPRDGPGVDERP